MSSVYTLLADIDDALTEAGIPGDTCPLRRVRGIILISRFLVPMSAVLPLLPVVPLPAQIAQYHEAQAETKRAYLQAQFAKERNTELYQQLDRQQARIVALRRELEKYAPAAEVQGLLLEATP